VLGGRETISVECRITLTKQQREFTLHVWTPWTPPPGWQPVPTPAQAQMPQRSAAQPVAQPQGYPAAYAPPAFAQPALAQQAPQQPPGFAPAPMQAPQQQAFAPAPQQMQAPYGQPAMPPAGALPPWMTPR
jgi:hypothetical protein